MTDQLQNQKRHYLSRRGRNALLTAHIVFSVGLLGDSAGFLAVAIRAAKAGDPNATIEMVKVLSMFAGIFGVPLSFAALLSGIALGLGTKWGVLRYPWVTLKLLLIVSVILVGAIVIRSALADALQHGLNSTSRLIAAAAYDVMALSVATGLSVFKPGKAFRSTTDS